MRGKESPRLPLCTQRRVTPQGTSVPLGRSPELCVTPRPSCASPPRKDKAESGGTPTSEGERPRGSAPLRPPARSLLPPQISHRAFLAAAADLLFMQQVPRGRTARFQPRSPPSAQPHPAQARCAAGTPLCQPRGARTQPLAGGSQETGLSARARQVLGCFSGFCPSAVSCKATGCGQDVPGAPVWPG